MTRARELSKFANANVLTISGTNVGIGSTIPTSKLNVVGVVSATTFNGTSLVVGSAVTVSSTGILAGGTTLDSVLLKNYTERVSALGNTGTASTINLTNGNVFTATLTDNCTFTFTTGVTTGAASFTLILTNDATAGRSIVWPVSVKWSNSSIPPRTTTANTTDIWSFFTPDNGTTWYGTIGLYNFT